jgi:hypothetical protein
VYDHCWFFTLLQRRVRPTVDFWRCCVACDAGDYSRQRCWWLVTTTSCTMVWDKAASLPMRLARDSRESSWPPRSTHAPATTHDHLMCTTDDVATSLSTMTSWSSANSCVAAKDEVISLPTCLAQEFSSGE